MKKKMRIVISLFPPIEPRANNSILPSLVKKRNLFLIQHLNSQSKLVGFDRPVIQSIYHSTNFNC